MRHHSLICAMAGVALAVFFHDTPVRAEDDYEEVAVTALLENPQNYWARGIVFTDVLTSLPGRKRLKVSGKIYYRFSTEQLGDCYAEKRLLPRLENMETGMEYVFSGTVVQRRRSYYVTVNDLKPAVVSKDPLAPTTIEALFADQDAQDDSLEARAAKLLREAEAAVYAYAQAHSLDTTPLTPDSPHFQRALQAIRTVVSDTEVDQQMTARELMSQFIAAILMASQPSPAAVGEPEIEAPVNEAAVPVIDVDEVSVPMQEPDEAKEPEAAEAPSFRLKVVPYSARILDEPATEDVTGAEEEPLPKEVAPAEEEVEPSTPEATVSPQGEVGRSNDLSEPMEW